MNDELKNRVAKLPAWARALIESLEDQAKPNNLEVQMMRQQVANAELRLKKMTERVDAMTELLTCAGRGGHETAQAYVDRVIKEYSSDEVS